MPADELAQLELLSELDALIARLDRWAGAAPDWQPAETCRAMVRRLQQRIAAMRVRWEAPLVVALLGGTGMGKSALINAFLGAEAVRTGRQRPTTTRPTLILRGDITPEMLGIDPAGVELIVRDLPMLRDLVLVDCPDPDTTEETPDDFPKISPVGATVKLSPQQVMDQAAGTAAAQNTDSNLARLRKILPHCDVLLVTATQQKYRSARVAEELAAAAAGARLVFVQTHADAEDDVRDDWRAVLADQYAAGHIFFIDSLSALADARENRQPRGEFAQLVDLLLHELAGAAGNRIRRANFLDLLANTLSGCRKRLDEAAPPVEQAINAIHQQRGVLASLLAKQMHAELLTSRRSWENRLLAETASRWGLSPFALVLRIYQGLGNWALGALLFRARTPAQIALWGTLEGVQAWRKRRQTRQAEQGLDRAAAGFWDQADIHKAGLILEGYATEAGVDRRLVSPSAVAAESESAGANFIARASADLQSLVASLAARHTGWFTRFCYEALFCAMIGCLLFRLAKNFFYDSWLAPGPSPALGLDFYLTAGFWLLLWCFLLIFALSRRLRRGLRREIDRLVVTWQSPSTASGLFADLESQCRGAIQFRRDLDPLDEQVNRLRRQLALPGEKIGHRM
ncbi:MAG: hypothetical protein ABSG67_04360 [Thermoguttaceae bacterium]